MKPKRDEKQEDTVDLILAFNTIYISSSPLCYRCKLLCVFFIDVYASVTCVFYIAIFPVVAVWDARAYYASSINAVLVSWIIFLFAVTSYP
jgi:hypothetical protein